MSAILANHIGNGNAHQREPLPLRTLSQNVHENRLRFCASVITTGAGLFQMCQGDLTFGTGVIFLGVKELYSQCQDNDAALLEPVLVDINAGVYFIDAFDVYYSQFESSSHLIKQTENPFGDCFAKFKLSVQRTQLEIPLLEWLDGLIIFANDAIENCPPLQRAKGEVLCEMFAKLKLAREEIASKLGYSDLAFGVLGGIAASSILPWPVALSTGITAAYGWHNGNPLLQAARKISEHVFLESSSPITRASNKSVQADLHLTGSNNSVVSFLQKKKGVVSISLGANTTHNFDYDLSHRRYPISMSRLAFLHQQMVKGLAENTITREQCAAIVSALLLNKLIKAGTVPYILFSNLSSSKS
jgi:hypothetical protein